MCAHERLDPVADERVCSRERIRIHASFVTES
jgi:hypothetical protein